jgi:hypothetical protein
MFSNFALPEFHRQTRIPLPTPSYDHSGSESAAVPLIQRLPAKEAGQSRWRSEGIVGRSVNSNSQR